MKTIFSLFVKGSGDLYWEQTAQPAGLEHKEIDLNDCDANTILESLNERATKINARAAQTKQIVDAIKKYVPAFADFYNENFQDFQYRQDGQFYQKWADKINALPFPNTEEAILTLDKKNGSFTVRVFSGECGYLTDYVRFYNADEGKPVDFNDGLFNASTKVVTPYELYKKLAEIKALQDTIAESKSRISELRSEGVEL